MSGSSSNYFGQQNAGTIFLSLSLVGLTSILYTFYLYKKEDDDESRKKKNGDNGTPIILSALYVYPIKSCAPLSSSSTILTEDGKAAAAVVTKYGFNYDRMFQVVDGPTGKYCTPRDKKYAKLFHIQTQIDDSQKLLTLSSAPVSAIDGTSSVSSSSSVSVDLTMIIPSDKWIYVDAMMGPQVKVQDYGDEVAQWIDTFLGVKGCRLVGMPPPTSTSLSSYHREVVMNPDQGEVIPIIVEESGGGIDLLPVVSLADEAPFLLASTTSLFDLNRRLKERGKPEIGMERFRPNLVISNLQPWEEDSWKRIKIGGKIEFIVWQRCGRCTMTTIDRTTLERGPEPLATLSEFRERSHGQRNFGMHLIPVLPSGDKDNDVGGTNTTTIQVGDIVEVLEYDEDRRAEWMKLFG